MVNKFEDLFSIATGVLGLLVIIIMLFSYKSNVLVNFYLVLVFLLVSMRLLHSGLKDYEDLIIMNINNAHLGPLYIFGIPSLYLYFKTLYKDSRSFSAQSLIHYIFPILILILNVLQATVEAFRNELLNLIKIAGILIYLFSYTAMTAVLVYKNSVSKKANVQLGPDLQHHVLIKRWTLFLCSIAFIVSLKLVFAAYSELYNPAETVITGYSYSFINSTLWLLTFAVVLFNPEILHGYPRLKSRINNHPVIPVTVSPVWNEIAPAIHNLQDAKLTDSINIKTKKYVTEIDQYVLTQHPFRSQKYAIKDLANDLNMPVSHVSYIFKYYCSMPFMEYKNYARINDSLALIAAGFLEGKTLEALSQKVGFSSYNPFYLAFKKHAGQAPKDYLVTKEGALE
jgi:AraC-like DNA-binding protein